MHDLTDLISPRVSAVGLSAIKDMAMRSAAVAGAVSLAWGLPSFRTPEHIRAAVHDGLERDPDIGKYALPDGLPAFRDAIARHYRARTGAAVDPKRNVLVSAGNMEALSVLFRVLLDPGDEVVLTDPGFTSHYQQIALRGAHAVPWALDENDGWRLDIGTLSGLVGERTRALVLVNPSNPTGTLFDRETLLAAAEIARAHNILIIVDDPYSNFVYDEPRRLFHLAAEPSLCEHLAYLFTFSKSYAMSGWRLGYMIVPTWLKADALKVHDATMICAPRIAQVAGIAALDSVPVHLPEFTRILAARRTLVCERLDRVPHVFHYVRPDGAYYVFPRILVEHADSVEFAHRLLDEAKVAVTPGGAFGPSGEHHVRMAYCVDEDAINLAFDRIEERYPR
jgi:aminotransferase